MLRALSMFGLGGIFLSISPPLRSQVWGALGSGVAFMSFHAPYTYIAGAILVFVSMLIAFNRGAQAR